VWEDKIHRERDEQVCIVMKGHADYFELASSSNSTMTCKVYNLGQNSLPGKSQFSHV
jgi:hypothetical protein